MIYIAPKSIKESGRRFANIAICNVMPITHYRKSASKTRTRKPVENRHENRTCPIRYRKPVGPTRKIRYQIACRRAGNRYRFLVRVFGADFWYVCHWHYVITHKSYRHEIFNIDGKWLWDHAVKFARWFTLWFTLCSLTGRYPTSKA